MTQPTAPTATAPPSVVPPDPDPPPAPVATAPTEAPRPVGVLYRDELERATDGGKAGYLLQALGPEAVREKGRFTGWQMTRLFASDPTLCQPCDLKIGDVIEKVNGRVLERPEDLSEMMATVSSTQEVCVQIRRGNARILFAYRVRKRGDPIPDDASPPCLANKTAGFPTKGHGKR